MPLQIFLCMFLQEKKYTPFFIKNNQELSGSRDDNNKSGKGILMMVTEGNSNIINLLLYKS